MPRVPSTPLEPRKSPLQARSSASVDAICEGTLQVLVALGKDRLTTTAVARRAGVSVGTLYQYFPNKSALLQAVLRRHLEDVTSATEQVCREQHGNSLRAMAIALVSAFLAAKMQHAAASVALYAVSSDLDAARIVRELGNRSSDAIIAMLETSPEPLNRDPALIAAVLQSAMAGVSRRLLESPQPARLFNAFCDELTRLACSYLESCTAACAGSSDTAASPSFRPERSEADRPASLSHKPGPPFPRRPTPWT